MTLTTNGATDNYGEAGAVRLDVRAISASLGGLIGERLAGWLLPSLMYATLAIAELAMLSGLMQAAITLPTIWYFHRVNAHALWPTWRCFR